MNTAGDWDGNASQLATFLKEHGLREVGLITFKTCNVGVGPFLSTFKGKLAAQGIAVGWLKGYRGFDDTETRKDDGSVHDIISTDEGGQDVLEGDARVRIVRGPGGLFEGRDFGRYKS